MDDLPTTRREPEPPFADPAPEQVAHWLLYALLKYWRREIERGRDKHHRDKPRSESKCSRRPRVRS
jgi:hypothetical protein